MYRNVSSRLRTIRARSCNRVPSSTRFASSSSVAAKQSSSGLGGIFGWFTGSGSPASVPLDFPLPGVVLPSPLPDHVAPGKTIITTLPNGAKVASETSPSPAASIGLYVDSGSIYETPLTFGATHLLERMAFKSTVNRSHFRVVREVEAIGGNVQASASREQMGYTFDALKTYVPEMVELLVDIVRNPAFLDWEVNEQLLKVKAEIGEASKNPHDLLLEAIHSAGFSGALANPLLASESALGRLNGALLEEFAYKVFDKIPLHVSDELALEDSGSIVSIEAENDEEKIVDGQGLQIRVDCDGYSTASSIDYEGFSDSVRQHRSQQPPFQGESDLELQQGFTLKIIAKPPRPPEPLVELNASVGSYISAETESICCDFSATLSPKVPLTSQEFTPSPAVESSFEPPSQINSQTEIEEGEEYLEVQNCGVETNDHPHAISLELHDPTGSTTNNKTEIMNFDSAAIEIVIESLISAWPNFMMNTNALRKIHFVILALLSASLVQAEDGLNDFQSYKNHIDEKLHGKATTVRFNHGVFHDVADLAIPRKPPDSPLPSVYNTVIGITVSGDVNFGMLKGAERYDEGRTENKGHVESEIGVVAADDTQCSAVGVSMLRLGGHVVHAEVAATLRAGVIFQASSDIGGGSFMVVKSSSSSNAEAFDMREIAPIVAAQSMYQSNPEAKVFGALSVEVSGELADLHASWVKHGRLPWKTLLQPAMEAWIVTVFQFKQWDPGVILEP